MADSKVVINLVTGLEGPARMTVAYLVGGAAAQAGKQVMMFLTKEAVRLAVPDMVQGVPAMAVLHCHGYTSSTSKQAGRCSSARSASTPASSASPS